MVDPELKKKAMNEACNLLNKDGVEQFALFILREDGAFEVISTANAMTMAAVSVSAAKRAAYWF